MQLRSLCALHPFPATSPSDRFTARRSRGSEVGYLYRQSGAAQCGGLQLGTAATPGAIQWLETGFARGFESQ